MGTLSRSAVSLVALVAALAFVGSLTGCVDDGEYYSSGEPPVAPPAGAGPDCDIGVAPPSAAGAIAPRAPHASPAAHSATPGHALREPSPLSNELEPAAFKTATCERNATD